MKYRIIISVSIFVVIALGAMAYIVLRQDNVVKNEYISPLVEKQPRLTKSEKVEQKYQPDSDPVGYIPVEFDYNPRFVSSDEHRNAGAPAPKETVASASTASMNRSEPSSSTFVDQAGYHNSPYDHQMIPDYGQYPTMPYGNDISAETSPAYQGRSSSQINNAAPSISRPIENQRLESNPQAPSRQSFGRIRHDSTPSYIIPDQLPQVPKQLPLPKGETPDNNQIDNRTMLQKIKDTLSKIPALVYTGLGLAGLYPFLKSKPDVVLNKPEENGDPNIGYNLHDKLEDVLDNYQQNMQDTPSDVGPMSGSLPFADEPVVSPTTEPESMIDQQPKVLDISAKATNLTGGSMFKTTNKLLAPVRLRPTGSMPIFDKMPALTSEVTQVPNPQKLITSDKVPSLKEQVYEYFNKRLNSTAGIVSLLTKAGMLGIQVGTTAYTLNQAHKQAQIDQAIDNVIEKAISQYKPSVQYLQPPAVTPPSMIEQVKAGNIGVAAHQLAAKGAMLRIR